MLEKSTEKSLRKWAMSRGWAVIKFTPLGDNGWMDRIFIWKDGTHVWVELKKDGEEPTPLQKFRIKYLKRRNCHVEWYDRLEDAKNYLKTFELGEHHEKPTPPNRNQCADRKD